MRDIGRIHKNFILLNIKGQFGKLLSLLNLVQMEEIMVSEKLANLFLKTLRTVKVMVFLLG